MRRKTVRRNGGAERITHPDRNWGFLKSAREREKGRERWDCRAHRKRKNPCVCDNKRKKKKSNRRENGAGKALQNHPEYYV